VSSSWFELLMLSPELLRESLDTANLECWERERTATPSGFVPVRLHATGCSLRETQAILRLFGVQRSHQAIFQWVHRVADSVPDPPEAQPKRVAVDETAVKINGEWSWLYAAIDLDTKLILGVDLFDLTVPIQLLRFCIDSLRKTRPLRGRVSRRWLRLSDCPCSIRTQRSA